MVRVTASEDSYTTFNAPPRCEGASAQPFGRAHVNTTDSIEQPRSHRARLLVVGLMLALTVVGLPGRATAGPAEDAGAAAWYVNQSRAEHGLHRLMPDRELQIVANRQANRMAANGYVFHTWDLGGQLSWGWQAWAENVGYGPSVEWIHSAFMNSGHHAGNILDPSYNYVGVGVAYGADGQVYVAQVFGAW